MIPPTLSCSCKEPPAINQSTHPRAAKQLLNYIKCLASTDQGKNQSKSRDCRPELRRKLSTKGIPSLKAHMSFLQGLTLSPPWCWARRLSWWHLHTSEVPLGKLSFFLRTVVRQNPLLHRRGGGWLGHLFHRSMCATTAFTKVNSGDKGVPVTLVGAVRSNDYDREGIHCHWWGNDLGPKSMAHTGKLEKAKAAGLATKLGKCTC